MNDKQKEKHKSKSEDDNASDGISRSDAVDTATDVGNDLNANDEPIDEELLALSPPPPSIQHAIFILIIIGFSMLVLGLFWPELRYFIKGFADPVDLGEAADLKINGLDSDSYVKVEGVPLVNRTVTFSTGTKWFSGDIFRKMAPLSGNGDLMVQWHTHNPEIKQSKDALTPPSSFAGRLKKRSDLSENYNKFWPFYDCLKLHNTSECKYCIGKKDLDECRPIFTCVNNYPIELCDQTAFFTRDEIQEKITDLTQEQNSRPSVNVAQELETKQRAMAAFENIDILSELVRIEELYERVDQLTISDSAAQNAFELQKKLFSLQQEALTIRLQKPLDKIAALSRPLRDSLEKSQKELVAAQQAVQKLARDKEKLGPLVDINLELAEFVETIKEQQERLRRLEESSEPLRNWKLDGNETGAQLLAKVRNLAATLSDMKLTKPTTLAAEPGEKDTDADNAADTDNNVDTDDKKRASAESTQSPDTDGVDVPDSAKAAGDDGANTENDEAGDNAATSVPPAPLSDPVLAAIDDQLNQAIEKVASVGRKLVLLSPGEAPQLDSWADETDIVGSLPKPLRADHVFKSFEMMQKELAQVTPKATETLKKRYKALQYHTKQYTDNIKRLENTSGLAELKLVQQYESLQTKVNAIQTKADLAEAVALWRNLSGAYAAKEFYPWDLSNYPEEQKGLQQLVQKSDVATLEKSVQDLEKQFAKPMYVLLDDEKPTDNPWILFVYIAVPIMLVINFRKLLRFIADWRQ